MAEDSLVVPLSGYRQLVSDRITPGRYRVRVDDAALDVSKNQNQMVKLWLRVQGGDSDGAILVDRLTMTEKALFRVVAFLDAVGIPTPKRDFTLKLSQIRGRYLEVDVEDGEPYLGKISSEVKGYLKIKGPVKTDTADDALDDLAEAAATNGTPDNPGVGGLDEFAPRAENGHAAAPTTEVDPAPSSLGVSQATPEADVPQDVDLDKLDL